MLSEDAEVVAEVELIGPGGHWGTSTAQGSLRHSGKDLDLSRSAYNTLGHILHPVAANSRSTLHSCRHYSVLVLLSRGAFNL